MGNRLNQRIAETIKEQIAHERVQSNTDTAEWRARCEVAQVAMYSDAERTTFIVTPDGKVAATVGGVNPVDNVNKSLEAVQKLKGG